MVKFLERPESISTGDRLMKGLSTAVQSIPDLISGYQKSQSFKKIGESLPDNQKAIWDSLDIGMKEKLAPSIFTSLQKKVGEKEKLLAGSKKYIKGEVPEDLGLDVDEISNKYSEYLNQGLSQSEARDRAFADIRGSRKSTQGQESPGIFDMLRNPKTPLKAPEKPFNERSSELNGYDILKEHPGKAAGSLALGAVAPIEELMEYSDPLKASIAMAQKFGMLPQGNKMPLASELARQKINQGLPEEQQKQAGKLEFLGGMIPFESLIFGMAKIGKNLGFLRNAEKIAAREGIEVAEAAQKIVKEAEVAGIDVAKAASGDKQEAGKLFNLSSKVSKEAPKSGTELRMARAESKSKMFPKEEKIATREGQLKAFPKYEQEIAKDAAERAARAEAKIPKTVKGMDSRKLRVHAAEKNLPVAQNGYRNAIARVRALEDEMASMKGPGKERIQTILEASKGELKDAEFFLKQTMQNIAGGEARVGLEEMRKAAQNKMVGIADQIAAGEEIKLAKMDYNPQMIQEAKNISKKKPIPSTPKEDFYQQVHKEYGDQYRKQLDRIEKELKAIPKSMGEAEQIRNLQKERDVLKKLIDQTEAERTIHRHKLGLRETAERQKAKERLGKMTKAEGNPKTEKVWKDRIQKAEGLEGKKKVIDEGIEQIIKEKPGQAEQIKKEGSSLKDSLDELSKKSEKVFQEKPKTAKEAAKEAFKWVRDMQIQVDKLLEKVPFLGKHWLGRDMIIGGIAGLVDELHKEYDLPITAGDVTQVIFGRAGFGIRYVTRNWGKKLTKWLINKHKVSGAEKAYREKRSKDYFSYSKPIQKQAKERVYGSR